MNRTEILSFLAASTLLSGPFVMAADQAGDYQDLARIGIVFDERDIQAMAMALDAQVPTPTIFAATAGVPAQFLQNWLPGLVRTITAARKIDEIIGVTTGGSWEDEEVIQTILEPTGSAVPYGDYTNVPLASWNPSYERRSVVRFEAGLRVGRLEDARASRINVNSATEKRANAAIALEILRNRIGFYGYYGGVNRTFGYLNDPSLPAYVTVATNGTTTQWSGKTFLQITADIRTAAAQLQTQSGDTLDPAMVDTVLVLPTNRIQYLSVTSDFGISVRQWLKETYPKMRVVSAPELNGANGGANPFYLHAETVQDGSSDGGRVFEQIVPAKIKSLGVEQQVKAYVEDYTNALAGVMLKRPWAVVRYSGI